jgi:hypothetical protein
MMPMEGGSLRRCSDHATLADPGAPGWSPGVATRVGSQPRSEVHSLSAGHASAYRAFCHREASS